MSQGIHTDLRYPTGPFQGPELPLPPHARTELIRTIAALPALLHAAANGLDDAQLKTPYRPGGWTLAQTIHHVADSHMNAYVRFKLALTEDEPTIKPYQEAAWAELPDSLLPVRVSLSLLDSLHQRWAALLQAMEDHQWTRSIRHPERGPMNLETMLALYAWHGKHHTAHITALRKANGW